TPQIAAGEEWLWACWGGVGVSVWGGVGGSFLPGVSFRSVSGKHGEESKRSAAWGRKGEWVGVGGRERERRAAHSSQALWGVQSCGRPRCGRVWVGVGLHPCVCVAV